MTWWNIRDNWPIIYGGSGQKHIGEKKIKFADYRRRMGL